jgi:hypothetical protein
MSELDVKLAKQRDNNRRSFNFMFCFTCSKITIKIENPKIVMNQVGTSYKCQYTFPFSAFSKAIAVTAIFM